MPKLTALEGVDIYMYFRDHAPPHVHAFHGDDEVLVVVRDGYVYAGSIPAGTRIGATVRGGACRRVA